MKQQQQKKQHGFPISYVSLMKSSLTCCLLFSVSIFFLSACGQISDNKSKSNSMQNGEVYMCSGLQEEVDSNGNPDQSKVSALILFIEMGYISGITCQSCHTSHHSHWSGLTVDPAAEDAGHGNYYRADPQACQVCHGEDLSTGAPTVNWISCNECHHGSEGMADGHKCLPCETCHDFAGEGGDCVDPPPPSSTEVCATEGCHDTGSHITHTSGVSKGPDPALACADCHGDYLPRFADDEDLSGTHVCDNCHSQGGAFNGLDSIGDSVGAKTNWDDMVYNEEGNALQSGKEKWCIGCHDNDPANCYADGSGIFAPNIAGDNNSYGFYANGHGSSTVIKECLDCHDTGAHHFDGEHRTYSFNSDDYDPLQSGISYAAGYRLKDVDGEVPLMIPVNYGTTFSYNAQEMKNNAFRLCFMSGCHNISDVLDNTPGDGINSHFKASLPDPPRSMSYAWGSGADTNEHVSHIMNFITTSWDSDWDTGTTGSGGSNGSDTLMACSSCHNVHGCEGIEGSTNEPMIRDGKFSGRSGYGFSYVIEDTDAGGFPWVTSNGATQSNSVGSIFRYGTQESASDSMCAGSMCHGDPSAPSGSSYDATGSSWGTYLEYYRPW